MHINTFLASDSFPELLHRVAEGGTVTYPLMGANSAFLDFFRKAPVKTRASASAPCLPPGVCIHINTFLAPGSNHVAEGGPVTYPLMGANSEFLDLYGTTAQKGKRRAAARHRRQTV